MLQAPVRRAVTDHHDAPAGPPGRQIGEEPRYPPNRLSMAFTTGNVDGRTVVDPNTLYWGGLGGSLVIVDIDARTTFAYAPNRMADTLTDVRGLGLAMAMWEAMAPALTTTRGSRSLAWADTFGRPSTQKCPLEEFPTLRPGRFDYPAPSCTG